MTSIDIPGGPVHVADLVADFLAELWEATLVHRRARGEPPPPAHLNPTRTDTTKEN